VPPTPLETGVTAWAADIARIVSCNTTALIRVLHALHGRGWVKRARAVLMRRATDPWESHLNGMINTAVPETKVPSHQGPDAQTVTPDRDITTMAGSGRSRLTRRTIEARTTRGSPWRAGR
jgi:glyceraldehyde-3-phosphate dehydrogenase (NAD(P))